MRKGVKETKNTKDTKYTKDTKEPSFFNYFLIVIKHCILKITGGVLGNLGSPEN
jgi:hypothetical protein